MGDRVVESNLWERFVGGDDVAYSELYNLYIDELFAYGMHFTPDRESVKDCSKPPIERKVIFRP